MPNYTIENLPKEELIKLLDIYAKNWLAMDGVLVPVDREKVWHG